MNKNQVENQVENHLDLNLDLNFDNFNDENDENIVCNIYKEQFDLINELPEEERLKVLYLAVFNAFYDYDKKNQKNQLENQVDLTYISNSISISISIYNSISNYSKKLLKLLRKTIFCKNYSNWGGKRSNSGRKKKTETSVKPDIIEDCNLYGEYNNVHLSESQYGKLVSLCMSDKLLNELINSFSSNIEVGKERPYNADLPNAHYERLKSYHAFRVKNPDKFREEQEKENGCSKAFMDFYEKAKAEKRAKGCIYD
jgi:hypothetical protein